MFPKTALLALVGAAATMVSAQTGAFTAKQLVQFSLNVENLESAFLAGGLAKYSAADFTTAGFTTAIRGRFQQIADSEALHVAYLTKAIGTDDAPVACTYDFTSAYTDVTSFVNLAQKIESIGASAYLGLAGALNVTTLKEDQTTLVLTAGGSVAAAKARQAGWITSAVQQRQPWDGAFETPLTPSAAWSLLDNYITSCPDANPDLPLKSLPTLTVSNAAPSAGDTITLGVTLKSAAAKRYAVWIDGLRVVYSEITNGKTVVPSGLSGTVYVGVVPSKDTADLENYVTGFAVVDFPFGPTARNVL
ncbi:hypothetical protein VTO73DRAFT_12385 [Trametes versicolor]